MQCVAHNTRNYTGSGYDPSSDSDSDADADADS